MNTVLIAIDSLGVGKRICCVCLRECMYAFVTVQVKKNFTCNIISLLQMSLNILPLLVLILVGCVDMGKSWLCRGLLTSGMDL